MMQQQTLFENAGRIFFTRTQVRQLDKRLKTAGMGLEVEAFAGYMALNVVIIGLVLALILFVYPPSYGALSKATGYVFGSPLPDFIIFPLILVLALVVTYLTAVTLLSSYLILRSETRGQKLEVALPDFLVLVASNIKAGMTLDQAMWYSAKPEFGLLSVEVKKIIKSSFSGESLEDALVKLSQRFDSRVFSRTINLIKQASSTGGELTEVLERTAQDVRNTTIMKKEIAASLVLYEIFVLFAAIVGTPFLFAVATKLITVFEKISPQLPAGGQIGGTFGNLGGMQFSGPIITSQEFFWFSMPTMFVTALIASFIVSIIRTGRKGEGLKYFPFVLILSLVVYWLVDNVILKPIFTTYT